MCIYIYIYIYMHYIMYISLYHYQYSLGLSPDLFILGYVISVHTLLNRLPLMASKLNDVKYCLIHHHSTKPSSWSILSPTNSSSYSPDCRFHWESISSVARTWPSPVNGQVGWRQDLRWSNQWEGPIEQVEGCFDQSEDDDQDQWLISRDWNRSFCWGYPLVI